MFSCHYIIASIAFGQCFPSFINLLHLGNVFPWLNIFSWSEYSSISLPDPLWNVPVMSTFSLCDLCQLTGWTHALAWGRREGWDSGLGLRLYWETRWGNPIGNRFACANLNLSKTHPLQPPIRYFLTSELILKKQYFGFWRWYWWEQFVKVWHS